VAYFKKCETKPDAVPITVELIHHSLRENILGTCSKHRNSNPSMSPQISFGPSFCCLRKEMMCHLMISQPVVLAKSLQVWVLSDFVVFSQVGVIFRFF